MCVEQLSAYISVAGDGWKVKGDMSVSSLISISIVTATFNRARLLTELYDSINNQQCRAFEWVIVDDGSTDETRSLVKAWIDGSDFAIHYCFQSNAGKQAAINNGIDFAAGELVLIVDSDDLLLPDAIGSICGAWNMYTHAQRESLFGIYCAMSHQDRSVRVRSAFVEKVDVPKQQYDRRKECDYLPAIRRDILCRRRFPVCDGEKFIAEGILWNAFSFEKGALFINRPVAVCRYQPDGSSANSAALRRKNIRGTLKYYAAASDSRLGLRNSFRARCNYQRFAFHAEDAGYAHLYPSSGGIARVIGYVLYWVDLRGGG